MANPKFLTGSKLKQFDIVVTNPMWNQNNFDPKDYENDPYERSSKRGGYAPSSSADWAWLQHVHASLKSQGRAAVVLDTGAASRGSGNQGDNKEKNIRKWFVDTDVVEGVILLPDNLFYNTPAPGMIIVLNNDKPRGRKGKLVVINASNECEKGRPKNFITDAGISKIAHAFNEGSRIEGFSTIVSTSEVVEADYSLSPAQFIQPKSANHVGDPSVLIKIYGDLSRKANDMDQELLIVFEKLGFVWNK